jgi:PPOX class probable F420-dependent enzyme
MKTLAQEQYVSLTTYRRNGEGVPTAVWIAPGDGDALLVVTTPDSGKVKRIRRDPRVSMVPCSRTGRVAEGATPVTGTAEVITDPDEVARLRGVIGRKYRVEYRLTMLLERLTGRRVRVILRIVPDRPSAG